jgi:hypothetical protein
LSIWLILLCRDYYVAIDWFEFWTFQHELKVRRTEHFTQRAVACFPVCHWHSSSSPALLLSSYLPILYRADLGNQCGCLSFGAPLSTVWCVVSLLPYDLLCFFLIPC